MKQVGDKLTAFMIMDPPKTGSYSRAIRLQQRQPDRPIIIVVVGSDRWLSHFVVKYHIDSNQNLYSSVSAGDRQTYFTQEVIALVFL